MVMAAVSWGATLQGTTADFSALTNTTIHADNVVGDGLSLCFQFDITAGTATAEMHVSLKASGPYVLVVGSSTSLDGDVKCVEPANGYFKPKLSACASCSVTTTFRRVAK